MVLFERPVNLQTLLVQTTCLPPKSELSIEILPEATRSVLVSQGASKVICRIDGPRSKNAAGSQAEVNTEKGTLACSLTFLPVCYQAKDGLMNHEAHGPNSSAEVETREQQLRTYLEASIVQAFEECVFLDKFPKAVLEIRVKILQLDLANILPVLLNAVSASLIQARIEMMGVVCAVKLDLPLGKGTRAADSTSSVCLALLPVAEKITFLEVQGEVDMKTLGSAISQAFKACASVNTKIRSTIEDWHVTQSGAQAGET